LIGQGRGGEPQTWVAPIALVISTILFVIQAPSLRSFSPQL